jgi:hypothetical protein
VYLCAHICVCPCLHVYCACQGCSVLGSVKSLGLRTFTHSNEPLECRLRGIWSSSNCALFSKIDLQPKYRKEP